jgi:hypothetical protein
MYQFGYNRCMNNSISKLIHRFFPALLGLFALAQPIQLFAQDMDPNMPGMDHSKMDHSQMESGNECADIMPSTHTSNAFSQGSGTSRLPGEQTPYYNLCVSSVPNNRPETAHFMFNAGDWMLMAHGSISAQYTNHSGPRGGDKLYATSMAMLMAEKQTDWGKLQLKSMISLEPLMSNRGYPNLFATGETASGQALVDRQHPHDLFMELAARIDVNVANDVTAFVYGGPVGEPALGPSAFMHRGSARLNPEAPITHHWFDSTHITYGVATAGVASRKLQLEASLFTGREPDEQRWNIEKPRFDSWSVRATWNPTPNWALQASYGRLKTPEFSTHPTENEHRTTASAHYDNGRSLSAMLAFSAKNPISGISGLGDTSTAWLTEANWELDSHHTLFGRIENVRNDELFPNPFSPLHDTPFRVSKFQTGYAYRLPLSGPLNLAVGGSVSAYAKPAALDTAYGSHPLGYTLFAKFSVGQ